MGIVDRYILCTFTKVFMICLISISGIYIVADFVGNLSEFVDHAGKRDSLWFVLAVYYGARLPWFFDLSSRIVALTSTIFVVTWLHRHNELTALMAAGISRRRIIAPLIVASFAISVLAAINREIGIPSVRYHLSRRSQDWVGDGGRRVRAMLDNSTGIWINGKRAYWEGRRISSAAFRMPSGLDDVGRRIIADEAQYQDADERRPAGYFLKGVTEPGNLHEVPSVKIGGKYVIYTPHDTDWLKDNECFVASDISFEQFEGGFNWCRLSSTAELFKGLRNPGLELASDVRILVHTRLIQPLLDMTLLFLGLPIVLSRGDRNMFVAVGLCVLVVASFLVVVLVFQAMGMNYLISPALAAWCPLIIFVPCAVALSEPLRR